MTPATLLAIAGLGVGAGGAIAGSRAQGKANDIAGQSSDRLYDLADQERQRRDAMTRLFLPKMLANMRMKPDAAAMNAAVSGGTPTGRGGGGLVEPGKPSMNMLNDVMIGGPIGAASNIFGGGRRAANAWTGTTQNDFGGQVAGIIDPIDAAKKGGTVTPEMFGKGSTDFERLLAEYNASADQYAGTGKNQAKVIGQMRKQFNPYIEGWRNTLKG